MIAGQPGFGLFGDALGRHKVYGKELVVTIFGESKRILNSIVREEWGFEDILMLSDWWGTYAAAASVIGGLDGECCA